MAIRLHPDFKDFLKLLNSHKVEYLIIGGYAVGFHGYPRATADIDIWIASKPANAFKMVKVMKDFGFNVPELSNELFVQHNKIIRLGNAPVRIEILTTISGVEFDECFRNRAIAYIDRVKVNIINLDDLKKNKMASAREKDLDDLKKLP
ncbi:nucleotidyltransferase [candidate division KSB1 bacterium]|nr:nucleotidyltransferase [candidate division KSB1 bacterium]